MKRPSDVDGMQEEFGDDEMTYAPPVGKARAAAKWTPILEPNFVRAGKVIERRIRESGETISGWARSHNLNETTLTRVCSGYYNAPKWASIDLLCWIASAMYNDEQRRQYFILEVLAASGIVPDPKVSELTAALVRVEHELAVIKRQAESLAHSARIKAQKDAEETA